MDEDTQEAAEHQQQMDEHRRREAEGWLWWPAYHDALLARQKAERQQLKTLTQRLRDEL